MPFGGPGEAAGCGLLPDLCFSPLPAAHELSLQRGPYIQQGTAWPDYGTLAQTVVLSSASRQTTYYCAREAYGTLGPWEVHAVPWDATDSGST
jgi:hypothetical protein